MKERVSKPITIEMLQAMSLDQRKTLQKNALSLDTPAAHSVLELLSQNDLLGPQKANPPKKAAAASAKARKPRATAAKKAAPKAKAALFGRQA